MLPYANVTPIQIQNIIHGAIFTRSSKSLKSTAVFFGGSNVEKTEELFNQAKKCFFGPLRVSLMSDPNGSNTTAVAAVLSAQKHCDLHGKRITVLAGTGPVGMRIGQLCAAAGAKVEICSRRMERAEMVCQLIESRTGNRPVPVQAAVASEARNVVAGAEILFAAGAAGVEMLDTGWENNCQSVQMAIDINAVPPVGIAGVEPMDDGAKRGGRICYGAMGVGKLKMQIHRAAIAALFESNELVLDLDEISELAKKL